MREGLLEAGGGGGGAGRLGRPGPAPAPRGVLGGSGGAAALGLSVGCEGTLLALAALLFGGAAGFGAAARIPGSCPGFPADMSLWPAGLRTGKPPANKPPRGCGEPLLLTAGLTPSLLVPLGFSICGALRSLI